MIPCTIFKQNCILIASIHPGAPTSSLKYLGATSNLGVLWKAFGLERSILDLICIGWWLGWDIGRTTSKQISATVEISIDEEEVEDIDWVLLETLISPELKDMCCGEEGTFVPPETQGNKWEVKGLAMDETKESYLSWAKGTLDSKETETVCTLYLLDEYLLGGWLREQDKVDVN